jgi:hypothetical protein
MCVYMYVCIHDWIVCVCVCVSMHVMQDFVGMYVHLFMIVYVSMYEMTLSVELYVY